jgi:hypothetical protein
MSLPVAFAVLAMSAAAAAAQERAPRTLAFVVGIEHYDDNELDRLQYAADDAKKVFEQLKVVTDLDPASVLLLADDDEKDSSKHRVDADRLRSELQAFVQLIKDRTHVVVYLGGHGTLSPGRALWYLPTDYDRSRKVKYVPFSEIQTTFADWINGQTLHDVTLTFLVNMCGAGNAVGRDRVSMSVDDNRELIDVAKRVFREENFGLTQYALIPATPKERNTFEDSTFKASVFAHHLVDGLSGRAATKGVVTAGSLFKYLSERIGEDLPRNGDFKADIPLGVTRKLEGESEYLVGTALLAAAQALDPPGASRERSDHRLALIDLASEQLGNVSSHSTDLSTRALLRRSQAEGLANRPPRASPDPAFAADPAEAEQLKQLTSRQSAPGPLNLRQLRDQLKAGEPFYAAIIDTERFRPIDRQLESGASAWQATLEAFPGHKEITTIVVPVPSDRNQSSLPDNVVATIRRWVTAEEKAAQRSRLFLVYVGVAGSRPMEESRVPKSSDGPERLFPFGKEEIEQAIARWAGPVTVCYLAPFGGELLKGAPPGHGSVSLLVAAQERNGMTFASAAQSKPSNVSLLARALQEGVEKLEEFTPLVEYTREMSTVGEPYVAGTARFIADWSGPDWTAIAESQLAPLRRFALHVARGCAAERLETCDAIRTVDPFDLLASAAQKDLVDQPDAAVPIYTEAVKALREEANASVVAPGAMPTRAALGQLADRVEERIKGGQARGGRRVVVLPIGVQDYASPLVPDLPGTAKDLEEYGRALTRAFVAAKTPVMVRAVRLAATADEIKSAIRTERDALGPEDLLILIYSGRGIETGGRRYISGGAARPCEEPGHPECVSDDVEWTELVDLWDIANLMADHWFFGIYDAQFTKPVFADRFNALLDKHLDSVRPGSPAEREETSLGPVTASPQAQVTLEVVPAGSIPARQLHIWLEGTLSAQAYPPMECGGEKKTIASPLAASIISELPPKSPGTYREWLQAIARHPCLMPDVDDRHPSTLVAQGDVDLALFTTGKGAELVDYFRSDSARREMNLVAAANVASAAVEQFRTMPNQLARAAVLLSPATLHPVPIERPFTRSTGPSHVVVDDWLATAGSVLEEVRGDAANADPAAGLSAFWAELFARRYVLGGDPALARAQLRDISAAVLARRNLARRLVELTDESARRQPTTLLDETSKVLEQAENDLGPKPASEAIAAARRDLAVVMRREESRRAARFVIAPRTAERDR